MSAIRTALTYAEKQYGIERLLVHPDLLTMPREVFLDRIDQLVNLGRAGQLAMKTVLESYLARIDRDVEGLPEQFYPYVPGWEDKIVLINPLVSFGRPILKSKGISTAIIAERVDAGETVQFIAADYDLTPREVDGAIVYERAA